MGDIFVLLGASSILTVAVLAMGLILAPGPQDFLDRILSRNVHNGTVGEVTRCMERNAEIGNPEFVEPFCRAKHSVPVSGALELDATCSSKQRIAITAENGSDDIVFTGFSLRAGENQPEVQIQGEWLAPGDTREYQIEALCVPGQTPDSVVAVARRGVRAESASALAAYVVMVGDRGTAPAAGATASQAPPPEPVQTAMLEAAPQMREMPGADSERDDDGDNIPTAITPTPSEAPRDTAAAVSPEPPSELPPAAEALPPAAPAPKETAAPAPPAPAASVETAPAPAEPAREIESTQAPAPAPSAAPPQPVLRLATTELLLRESDGVARIALSIMPAPTGEAWVRYTVIPESASIDEDFASALSGRATLAPGVNEAAILIPIVNDALIEREETLRVRLEEVSGGLARQGSSEVRIRIVDDD